MIITNQHQVSVISDLKQYGTKDDGTPFIGVVFYVMVETPRGDRYVHRSSFDGCNPEYFQDEYDSGYVFHDTRPQAQAAADHLMMRVLTAGEINEAYWVEDRPAYGSEAYIEYGQADDAAFEKEMG